VFGQSTGSNGVHGLTSSNKDSAIFGEHTGQGIGVLGTSATGIGVFGKGPQNAGFFEGDVTVTGDIRLINADVAENFDITDAVAVSSGSVMVLDDLGTLRPSTRSYDKRVVGVVSGAGHFKPAILLDSSDSPTSRTQIALVGKVFCKVDACAAPIEVGDLLTTSETPGHAMKASNPMCALGALIGKALRRLDAGQGMIPILVALQ
jgi:hypothetical protein